MSIRRTRTTRPPTRRYRVTERDRELLAAVGGMGQATAEQLRRLFFGSDRSTALRRLAKLVALRLLDVRTCHMDEPNVYVLAPRGRALLLESGCDPCDLHRSKVGRHLDLHVFLLNEVRVEIVVGCRGRTDVVLEAFHGDLDLRRAAGSPPPRYVPDAIAEFTMPAGPLALVIEIDTGAEGRSVFRTKVETTVALWRDGHPCWGAPAGTWRPVVFVPTAARARSLSRAIHNAGGADLWLVTELDRLRAIGALGPLFAAANDVVTTPTGPLSYTFDVTHLVTGPLPSAREAAP